MGFHTILTLGYLIPGICLYLRMRHLFIPKEFRIRYTIAFTVLFLIYPVSNIAGDGSDRIIDKILSTTSNYLLPFYLYLLLFVILTDLLLLANNFLRIANPEKIRDRSFRLKAFIVIICLSAMVVVAGIINFNAIRITEYKINVPKKSSDLDHLKIAFISDFHLKEGTPVGFVRRAVQKVNGINPDLMIFGGDIIEGDRQDENLKELETLLKGIASKYGVYGVPGNHEHYAGQERGSFFGQSGINILSDSAVIFGKSLILVGRNDGHIRTRKSLVELMRSIPDSLPVILVDHRPTELNQVAGTKTGVQFSGHTHNGQLFPINFITKKVYELSMGCRKFGNTYVIVSSGIRLWGPPVRTTGKSEIVVADISFTR
jgi:uncharacterized protein